MKLDGWEIRRADEMDEDEFQDERIILETERMHSTGFWLFPPSPAYAIWARDEEHLGVTLSKELDKLAETAH